MAPDRSRSHRASHQGHIHHSLSLVSPVARPLVPDSCTLVCPERNRLMFRGNRCLTTAREAAPRVDPLPSLRQVLALGLSQLLLWLTPNRQRVFPRTCP